MCAENDIAGLGVFATDINVVIGMVAHRMPFPDNFLEPIDVLLLQGSPEEKAVDHPALGFDPPARLQGVPFGRFIQISFDVVPFRVFPLGVIHRHLEIERDGDQSLVVIDGQRVDSLAAVSGRRIGSQN